MNENKFIIKNGVVVESTSPETAVFEIEGSNGLLVSINDTITGNTFSVSNVTGGTALGIDAEGDISIEHRIIAAQLIKSGGTSAQFLKADGSVDSSSYSQVGHTHPYLSDTGGTVSGNLYIAGDLVVTGSTYQTHTNEIFSKNDYITLREGAVSGLANGAYTGIEAIKYDGVNNGRLVFDNQGWAKVGDSGNEQVIATRISSPGDGQVAIWDANNYRLNFIPQSTFAPASGSPNYIQLSPANAQSGNIKITGTMNWGTGAGSSVDASGLWIEQVGTNTSNENIRLQTSKSGDLTNYISLVLDPTSGFQFNATGTGNGIATFNSTISSTGFIKSGSSDSYILLGAGGHKAVSDFVVSSVLGNYSLTGHTHDERYYTETESDGRYAYKAGSSDQDFYTRDLTVNRADSDSIYMGSSFWLGQTYIGLRAGTDKSFNIDTYNNGSGLNVLKILQSGAASFSSTVSALGGNSTQWNTAYGWGNHASAGYASASSLSNYSLTSHTHNQIYSISNAPASALLVNNRTDDEAGSAWIYWDALGGIVNPWGIKHNQPTNLIEFYGAGNLRAYVDLNSGSGKVLVNSDIGNSIAAYSHTHDDRYYTETESDGRYAPISSSANYIQNQQSSAQAANLWISGNIYAGGNYINSFRFYNNFSGGNAGFDVYNASGTLTFLHNSNGGNTTTLGNLTAGGEGSFGGKVSALGGNSTQWNTAYAWGNHAGLYLPLSGGILDTPNGEIIISPTGWREPTRAAIKVMSKADTPAEIDLRHKVGGIESGWHISARGSGEGATLNIYRYNMTSSGVADASAFTQLYTFNPNGVLNVSGGLQVSGQNVIHSGNIGSQNVNYAASAGTIYNTGTVTLGSAIEANSITITQPSYTTDKPVKLLNFHWYSDVWSLGNIRSGSSTSNGLGVFLNSIEKYRFTDSTLFINSNIVYHSGNLTSTLTSGYLPYWNGSSLGNSKVTTDGTSTYINSGGLNVIGEIRSYTNPDYYAFIRGQYSQDSAFSLGVSGHNLMTSGDDYYFGQKLHLWTSDVRRLSIVANGNVGIGTTNPASTMHIKGAGKLVVESTSGSYGQFQILNTLNGESSIIIASNVTSGIGGTIVTSDPTYMWGLGVGRYGLPNNVFTISNTSATSGLAIFSNGNIGLGYGSDQGYKLAVAGSGYFSGDISITSLNASNAYLGGIIRVNRPSNKVDNSGYNEFRHLEINNPFVAGQSSYVQVYWPSTYILRFGGDYDGNVGGAVPEIQIGTRSTGILNVSPTGEVKIGHTDNWGYRLSVSGDVRFNSALGVTTNIQIGTQLGHYIPDRAELNLVSVTNIPCDFWMGSNSIRHWSLGSRGSDEGNALSLYTPYYGHMMRWFTNGNVGIGHTSDPGYKFAVNGTFFAGDSIVRGQLAVGNNTNGTAVIDAHSGYAYYGVNNYSTGLKIANAGEAYFSHSVTATAFYHSSDITLKNVIKPLEPTLDKLRDMDTFYYTLKSDSTEKVQLGMSAQDFEDKFPTLVGKDSNDKLQLEYARITVLAVKAIQELDILQQEQKKRIIDLENEINELKQKIYGTNNNK